MEENNINWENDPADITADIAYNNTPAVKNVRRNSKKPLFAIIGVAAAALIAAVALVFFLGSPERVAKKYMDAWMYGDVVTLHKYLAYDNYADIVGDMDEDDYFEDLSEKYDEDITSWEELAEYNYVTNDEWYSDEYGDYKIEITVSKVKDKTPRSLKKEFESVIDRLEEYTDYDHDDVSAGKVLEIKVKIKGDEDSLRTSYNLYMVKMGLSWKIFNITYND